MNKNYIIPILLINLLLMRSPLRAQNFCMTPSSTNVSNINRMLETAEGPVRSNNQSYPLRIYFHVIRKTDGTGGQSYSNVEQAYQILNNDFNPHNIFFVWNDSIDYIDYTPYYYLPNISIFNINNHSNGIDIYLYPDEIYGDGHGKGNGVGISSEYYVAGKYSFSPYPSLITSHVVSHEMGHVLFLWHTHHGTFNEGGNDSPCAELVNGSNSYICGDYIVDTPADPHLHFNVNPNTYQWLGSGQDANGDNYQPDTRQIMSYTDIRCMTYFSSGQGERMRNAIEQLPYLQAASVSLHGPTVPTSSSIYYLENLPSNYSVTWAWKNSSTIPIVSNTPYANSCTISNSNKAYINNSLVATICKGGNVITAIEKAICSGANFSGTYSQEGGQVIVPFGSPIYHDPIPTTPFADQSYVRVHTVQTFTLTSSMFSSSTLTSEDGSFPTGWNQNGNTITYNYPRLGGPSIPVIGRSNTGYDVYKFTVKVIPDLIDPGLPILSPGNGTLTISLGDEQSEDGNSRSTETDLDELAWDVEIVNVLAGDIAYKGSFKGRSQTISTNGWTSGFYVVRIDINGESISRKIYIVNSN